MEEQLEVNTFKDLLKKMKVFMILKYNWSSLVEFHGISTQFWRVD